MHIEVKSFWNRGSKQSVTSGFREQEIIITPSEKYIHE